MTIGRCIGLSLLLDKDLKRHVVLHKGEFTMTLGFFNALGLVGRMEVSKSLTLTNFSAHRLIRR